MKIAIDTYPQLKALCWNRQGATEIDAAEALAIYERNWRFVDLVTMQPHEKALLKTLAENFGNGALLTA